MLQQNITAKRILRITAFVCLFGAQSVWAQTTAFTYQGKLNNGASQAAGNFDMQFRLFDDPDAGEGTQAGATVSRPAVAISSGVFSVQLDFGAAVFAAGATLYLELSIRPAGSSGGYTSLAPRQQITSAPYTIRSLSSLNSEQLGGIAAGSYLQTNGDASALTNLNADNLASGTIGDARLSPNIARLDAAQTFTGANNFNGLTLDGDSQIIAPRLENAANDPAPAAAENAGRIYFNTTTNSVTVSNGTIWQSLTPNNAAPNAIQTFSGNAAGSVSCNNGIIQNVTFTKNLANTRLRITYHDQMYAFGSTSTFRLQIKLYIDNAAISPLSLQKGFLSSSYSTQTGTFFGVESPVTIVGYAENVAAGTHALSSKYLSNPGPACTKGEGGSPFLMEIKEVP